MQTAIIQPVPTNAATGGPLQGQMTFTSQQTIGAGGSPTKGTS